MKFRYVVTTFVEAESIEEAIKKAKRTKPHEVNLHGQWWERQDYRLNDSQRQSNIGFSDKK